MLIEFSVANFRSFREKQTLSMVAAPKLRKLENTFKPDLSGEKFPRLLKTCIIYGPNASGKSNLLRAIEAMSFIARLPPISEARLWRVAPFRFDPELVSKPSSFEAHFIHGGMRYQFELSVTSERIHFERLRSFPKGKEVLLFERRHTESGDQYTFGRALEGGEVLHGTWRKLTAPNVLFLSQAVANSNEDLHQLRVPHQWLTESICTEMHGMQNHSKIAQGLASDYESLSDEIATFLRNLDVPISKLRVKPIERAPKTLNALGGEYLDRVSPTKRLHTTLTHVSALGDADLSYDDESEGTKNLIGFWLPWTTRGPSTHSARHVLVIDELDSSLHPKIVVALVEQHLSSPIPSQLIFTTHDTHLMDAKLLRRDQIWITERDSNGATQLRSIHDFQGRDSEDIEKRYYEGRYRGLPLLKGD